MGHCRPPPLRQKAKIEMKLSQPRLSKDERLTLELSEQKRAIDQDLFDGMFTAAHTRSDQQ